MASPDLVKEKWLSILIQVGIRKEKDIPDVPLLSELATNADGKAILEFVTKSLAVGRPTGTTPGVPAERLAALRKAFKDTLSDPVFLAAAKKVGLEVNPIYGEEMRVLITAAVAVPGQIKDRVKAVMPPVQ